MKEFLSARNTFAYSLRIALRKQVGLLIVFMLSLTVILNFELFSTVSWLRHMMANPNLYTEFDSTIMMSFENYKYIIFTSDSGGAFETAFACILALIAIAVAIMAFHFITSKKTVNVYYSLGITRAGLFASRFLSGVITLLLILFVPFMLSTGANWFFFGASKELFAAAAYLFCSYFVLTVVVFAISCAAISAVGTIFEGLLHSVVLTATPSVFFALLDLLMQPLVYGSAYGYVYYTDGGEHITLNLIAALNRFNPLLFNVDQVMQVGNLDRAGVNDKFVWQTPAIWPVLLWAAVACALFFVGLAVFRKRRVEVCGFIGTNRVMNTAITAIVGIMGFALVVVLMQDDNQSLVLSVLAGLLVYCLLYVVMELVLLRNTKRFVRGLKKLPFHLAAPVLVILVFTTGLFGFSTRTPDLADIESVAVMPVANLPAGSNVFYSTGRADLYYLSVEEIDDYNRIISYHQNQHHMLYGDFTDKKQIEALLALHKEIAAQGGGEPRNPFNVKNVNGDTYVQAHLVFVYTLKDGRQVARTFDSTTLALLEKTALVQHEVLSGELFERTLEEPPVIKNYEQVHYMSNWDSARFWLRHSNLAFLSKNMIKYTEVTNLSEEAVLEIYTALYQDYQALSAQEWLFPEGNELGTLRFVQNPAYYNDPEEEPFEDEDEAQQETVPMPGTTMTLTDGTVLHLSENAVENSDVFSGGIVINQNMTHTIAALGKYGLLTLFADTAKIVDAKVYPAVKPLQQRPTSKSAAYGISSIDSTGCTLQFGSLYENYVPLPAQENEVYPYDESYSSSPFENYSRRTLLFPETNYKVTDKALLTQLYENSYLQYYNSRSGYYVEFTLDTEGQLLKYVPAENMPQQIAAKADALQLQK